MAISETVELLGKGLYDTIPDVLTLTSIPTASELEAVGNEDFDRTMVETILPQAVKEDVNFYDLLEIDFYWLCRCLRILNYGPYHTTNAIFCDKCGQRSFGEYIVDLSTIECKPLPEGFKNDIVVSKDEFIEYDGDIHFKLLTLQEALNSKKDRAFQTKDGVIDRNLSRLCYMISDINGNTTLTPPEKKIIIQKDMISADYIILSDTVREIGDYGLRAGGFTQCPKCSNPNAGFIALVDDRFFRPSLGALRRWKNDRSSGKTKDVPTGKAATV